MVISHEQDSKPQYSAYISRVLRLAEWHVVIKVLEDYDCNYIR